MLDEIKDIGANFNDKIQLKNIFTKKINIYDVRINKSKL